MNPYCSEENRKRFNEILNNNKVVAVCSLGCPPCKKIKAQFNSNNIQFHETNISDPDNEELFYCIYEKSKSRYVPQIFHNGSYLGGFTEAMNHLNQGKF